MGKRLAAAVIGLALVTAAGCGDDDFGTGDPETKDAKYADIPIYYQEAEFDGVYYDCLLAGYKDAPALWCERDEDEGSE